MANCNLCPRGCNVDRSETVGFCGAGSLAVVAKIMLHSWEEPCICYGGGSGAVFFSGCQLRCAFCQNHEISCRITGRTMDADELCDAFLRLEEKGACNINLISPTPHIKSIRPALEQAKTKGLAIPIVFNSGGYESVSTLQTLDGLIDVYLPDYKFFDSEPASLYANAPDYAQHAEASLLEMFRQTGKPIYHGDHLLKGMIVRHLVLPNHSRDSVAILERLRHLFEPEDLILSLLRQYTPVHRAKMIPKLSRRITSLEYKKVLSAAIDLGFRRVYQQEKDSAKEDYIPDFHHFGDKILDK